MNKAYEFLCSKDSKDHSGPNPDNIVLILRAQSILFSRYKIGSSIEEIHKLKLIWLIFVELSPYKYAGYPQLVKTIKMETSDEALFSKQVPLLSSASELAFHTVDCSALNAEELRREGGIDVRLKKQLRDDFFNEFRTLGLIGSTLSLRGRVEQKFQAARCGR